jgi:hypothetical protein
VAGGVVLSLEKESLLRVDVAEERTRKEPRVTIEGRTDGNLVVV